MGFSSFLQLLQELHAYTVVERDGSIIACAALFPFLDDKSGEVAAFAVSPECRGHGRGDSLLGNFTLLNSDSSPVNLFGVDRDGCSNCFLQWIITGICCKLLEVTIVVNWGIL